MAITTIAIFGLLAMLIHGAPIQTPEPQQNVENPNVVPGVFISADTLKDLQAQVQQKTPESENSAKIQNSDGKVNPGEEVTPNSLAFQQPGAGQNQQIFSNQPIQYPIQGNQDNLQHPQYLNQQPQYQQPQYLNQQPYQQPYQQQVLNNPPLQQQPIYNQPLNQPQYFGQQIPNQQAVYQQSMGNQPTLVYPNGQQPTGNQQNLVYQNGQALVPQNQQTIPNQPTLIYPTNQLPNQQVLTPSQQVLTPNAQGNLYTYVPVNNAIPNPNVGGAYLLQPLPNQAPLYALNNGK